MVLSTIAEHSLPLSLAPVLVELSRALAQDKTALDGIQLSRTSASYKMVHGLGLTIAERICANMKVYPYSLNIDEATSDTNKKVLAVLVSYYNMTTRAVEVEHLTSLELFKVNSVSIYNALVSFFSKHDLPLKNLVSTLLDSCAVMRGSKQGLETRIRDNKNPKLLDVDGDSCHHIHNSSKAFCKPFDNWLEGLFQDLFEDHRWSSDQSSYLQQVCEILEIPFTQPPRFLNHRWLSAYDSALSLDRLLPAYKLLYFGFMKKDDQEIYDEVVEELYREYGVNDKGKRKIKFFHNDLTKKSMTDKGKLRKKRIVEKIFFSCPKTLLHLSLYQSVLPIMKSYVMVFQRKETLIHKLHDNQLETFCTFLGCFMKPESFSSKNPAELVNLDVSKPGTQLKKTQMFMGKKATEIVEKRGRGDKIVCCFLEQLETAYLKCAEYMQKTLPLNSTTLKGLSALDPLARGHSVTQKYLEVLGKKLEHLLPSENNLALEIIQYNVDRSLTPYDPTMSVVDWWGQIIHGDKYPSLAKIASAAFSIFHGPQVESSFSLMSDILDKKAGRMNAQTFSAIQTVKYSLRSQKKTAVELYNREDAKYSSVDKRLCRNIRNAAKRDKEERKECQEKRLQRLKEFGVTNTKKSSAAAAVRDKKKEAELTRKVHAEKQRNAARKRALEALVTSRSKKVKVDRNQWI